MLKTKFFPTLLIILDICAAAGYGLQGWHEWRKIFYWLFAAGLTYCVTW
jgi:hypothetical protein